MRVTALVITYNHSSYVAAALESALRQEVDFEYEILVSEDCSTDGTREIVHDFHRRHPARIRLLLSERNLRNNEVIARGLRAARGQYIALLDGDDYWTSARKLQKQVDFLDRHSECAICFHNAQVVHEDGSRAPWLWTPENQKEISSIADIWRGNFIATASAMFRNGLIKEIPDWYITLFPITDWPLHILNAEHGMIGYIDEVMSVYRYHQHGLYSSKTESEKLDATAGFYRAMDVNLGRRYHDVITAAYSAYFFEWAEEYLKRGDRARARSCLLRSLMGGGVGGRVSWRAFARLAARLAGSALLGGRAASPRGAGRRVVS
jgi:glycosyltransferase involved in cell wall biosynthesis